MIRFVLRAVGRPNLLLASALPIVLVAAGWIGVTTWFPHHLRRVTGRDMAAPGTCFYCHFQAHEPPRGGQHSGPRYISPAGMAVSADGGTLYVAAEGADELLEVDLAGRKVTRVVPILGRPHGVAISADGHRLAVSRRDQDQVTIFALPSLTVVNTIATGDEPLAVTLSADASRLYVVNNQGDDVSLVSLAQRPVADRLGAGHEPYAAALSRDGDLLVVANRLARPGLPRAVPESELTLIDARQSRVLERRQLESAHMSEGVALAHDGSFALASIIRVRNLLPITEVARGAVMTSGLAYVETARGGRTVQFPLDDVNRYYPDPAGVAMTPDDSKAFVAAGGARTVTAVDLRALRARVAAGNAAQLAAVADDLGAASDYVLARIPTRDQPRTLAMSPDGRKLYVAERLNDSIAVIDTTRLEVSERIDLGGPRQLTAERRGERVFHDASITFQGEFSCRSCHPDGHSDGLVYDFDIDGLGRNPIKNKSLRGIRDTAPFKWNGGNPDLATQCGPRFAKVLTRSDAFKPDDLRDLVAYIESIPLPERRMPPELATARERGKKIFDRHRTNGGQPIPVAKRCGTCHRPPLYTDRLKADVGSSTTFDSIKAYDTPQLLDVKSSAPYLHNGSAVTLEEIWTVYNPKDTHGMTNDLSKPQLNDLIIFLRSL